MIKKILYALASACLLLAAVSCTEKYRDEYKHLRVDRTYLKLESEGGEIPIMVYYSGSWNVAIDEDCNWASLDRTSGKGIGTIHFNCEKNSFTARETNLTLSNDKKESITINIVQNAGI